MPPLPSRPTAPRPTPLPPVLVAGGINADVLGRTLHAPQLHTSNPAVAGVTPGGVGRNIAEHLARLLPGRSVRLLGAVGRDVLGVSVLDATARAGVNVDGVLHLPGETGLYLAVLDDTGELHVGLAAMALTDTLTPDVTAPWRTAVPGADLLVLDANLPPGTVLALLDAARAAGVRAVIEPVSAPKAARLATALAGDWRGVHLVKPDRQELAALTGEQDPDRAARTLLGWGARHVLLTLGAHGSVLYGPDGEVVRTPCTPGNVRDVTGAGDALVAGVCAALTRGWPVRDAVRLGHACAALTIASAQTVPDTLTWDAALHALPHGDPHPHGT